MQRPRPRCHSCRRFVSREVAERNRGPRPPSETGDREPDEIVWCDDCGARMENV